MYGFYSGIGGHFKALRFAFRNGMGWLFLVPILVWALFAAAILTVGVQLTELATGWTSAHLGIDVPQTEASGWRGFRDDLLRLVDGARELLVLIVVKVALFYLVGILGKYVVLVLLSPVLAYASERTEELLTGRSYPFHLGRLLLDAGRGALMAVRNGSIELGINLLAWVLTLLVPVLAPVTALLLIWVSCWFYGFSMFDYLFERQRLGIGASLRAARAQRAMVMGNGFVSWGLMRIPVIGWVLAPLMGAIGAVLSWHEGEQPRRAPLR